MNTLSYQLFNPTPLHLPEPSAIDWLDCEWGGPYDEDLPEALCGSWSCSGDCYECVVAEAAMRRLFLPIQGPVNKDGVPLGYLLITE